LRILSYNKYAAVSRRSFHIHDYPTAYHSTSRYPLGLPWEGDNTYSAQQAIP